MLIIRNEPLNKTGCEKTGDLWIFRRCISETVATGGDLGGQRGAPPPPKTWSGGTVVLIFPQYFIHIIINCTVFVSFVSRLNRKIRVPRLLDCDSPCFLPVHNTADFSRRTSKTVHCGWCAADVSVIGSTVSRLKKTVLTPQLGWRWSYM